MEAGTELVELEAGTELVELEAGTELVELEAGTELVELEAGTEWPSGTVRSSPVEAVGAVLDGGTSVTVIVTWSVVVALCWSVTLRVKVMAVVELTCGAVNEGVSASSLEMARPGRSEVQP